MTISKNWIASWLAHGSRGWFPFGVEEAQPFPVTHEFWNEVAATLRAIRSDVPPDATLMALVPMAGPAPIGSTNDS